MKGIKRKHSPDEDSVYEIKLFISLLRYIIFGEVIASLAYVICSILGII